MANVTRPLRGRTPSFGQTTGEDPCRTSRIDEAAVSTKYRGSGVVYRDQPVGATREPVA